MNSEYFIFKSEKFKDKKKCAVFDLDGTIIKTKSRNPFPIDEFDWEFNEDIQERLIKLSKTYCIYVITNQSKCNEKWIVKINNIIKEIGFPVFVYMIKDYNKYRKPFPTLLNILKEGRTDIFYCGDMRTDAEFAENAGVRFIDVRKFLGYEPDIILDDIKKDYFADIKIRQNKIDIMKRLSEIVPDSLDEKIIIFVVGYPVSGKTTISKYIETFGYLIIHQNEFRKFKKIVKECNRIVIDGIDISKIPKFMNEIKSHYVQCIKLKTSLNQSLHNMYYRIYKFSGEYISKRSFNEIKMNSLKRLGFNEIIEIDQVVPDDEDYRLMFY